MYVWLHIKTAVDSFFLIKTMATGTRHPWKLGIRLLAPMRWWTAKWYLFWKWLPNSPAILSLAVPQCSPHCEHENNNFFLKLTINFVCLFCLPTTNKNKNVMYKAGKYERNVKFLKRMWRKNKIILIVRWDMSDLNYKWYPKLVGAIFFSMKLFIFGVSQRIKLQSLKIPVPTTVYLDLTILISQ